MAQAAEFEGWQELLKIPPEKQDKSTIEKLHVRRKYLADLFFNKETPKEEKIKIQDELAALQEYFKYKPIYKIGTGKGGGYKPVTKEERIRNCNDFCEYLLSKDLWNILGPDDRARTLALVWGSVK